MFVIIMMLLLNVFAREKPLSTCGTDYICLKIKYVTVCEAGNVGRVNLFLV